MKHPTRTIATLFFLAATGALLALSQLNLSAISEPGRTESYVAVRAKRLLVRWNSHDVRPPTSSRSPVTIAEGDKLYGAECAACHGLDGSTPTDAGRWMYPRAADLASAQVQQYSDTELFWIVKNGIRLSGMPAFGRVESDEHIWALVQYLRSLRSDGKQVSSAH